MKKRILFIIPFFYKWANYSNVRANYEFLQKEGYEVDILSKKEEKEINFENYDLVMLHGSGATLSPKNFEKCNVPVIALGWSDPNIFNELHFSQGTFYLTNDLHLSKQLLGKKVIFYNTACDKRHHKDLKLEKTTDILCYGAGTHKFVTDRNETINKLRELGFNVKVLGRGWDAHKDTHGFTEGEALSREICQAHLLLDLSDGKTAWPHRVFEASSRGTPAITYNREDTRLMFEENKEILLYDNFECLSRTLAFYFKEGDVSKEFKMEELRTIGLNAQKRCYADHDISVRIKQLIKIIEEEI